jgi:hypothetical protein
MAHENFFKNVGEEFCESVAAYFLGFCVCDDEARCFNPFVDRPLVKTYIEHFLQAEHLERK